jgi:flagellar biosynthesis GTPase FlhF
LSFTPIVIGNRVHLKVKPEVSSLDFTNAVSLNGFRIPALSTRRTETEVELNDGQTFAIAGLMNNTMNTSMQKIPGIGDIPILGLLFKSKAAQRNQTELVVMITPEILANNSPGVTPNLPKLGEPFLPPMTLKKEVPQPTPAFKTEDVQPVAPVAAAPPVPAEKTPVAAAKQSAAQKTPTPAAAAATLKANSPANRAVVHAPDPEPAKPAAAQVATSAPENAAAPENTNRPASAQERQAAERARKQERQREELAARAMAEENKRHQKQAEEDRRKQKVEDERLAKINRAQALRDAELAKQAEEQSKIQAKKQAEIDAKHQKEIADAQNRLRAAQAAYQDELTKLQGK